jgi:hypothetical protein
MRSCVAVLTLASAFVLAAASGAAPAPSPLHFTTFAVTDLPLGDVVWTGSRFLYNAENLGKLETSDAAGHDFKPFASFDQGGEEMRCVPAPTAPRYWPQGIYCHTPDNRIVRFAPDGSAMTAIAQLPSTGNSDGAIAFDTVGRFGYALVAATGGSASTGGQLFAIRTSGKFSPVGSYAGPGGAENVVIAPARFGSAGGWALIAVDQDGGIGRLLAMDAHGNVKTVGGKLPYGINPIALVEGPAVKRAGGLPAAGLYLADTNSKTVWFTPASGFAEYAGGVVVGTEKPADNVTRLYLVRPRGGGFQILVLAHDLPSQSWNFESAAYVP